MGEVTPYPASKTYYPRAAVTLTVILEGETTVRSYAVIPRSVEVERNDHRHADTATIEIDFINFPLDPRAVRSILVEVFFGDIKDPALTAVPTSLSWRRFIGYVDEPETTLEDAADIVRMKCRDYTSLFLDARWSGKAIDISGPLVDVLETFLLATPGASTLPVVFDAAGSADLVLATMIGRTKFAAQAKDDTWTVLVDLLGKAGLIPVVVLDELRIKSATDITMGSARFSYGKNVSRVVRLRKFNETATQQIQVVSWDAAARAARVGTYPLAAITTRRKVSTSGKVSTETAPILAFYVAGSYSEAELGTIAQAIYNEVGREQFEGTMETAEMVDSDGEAVLGLSNGDQIIVTLGDRADPSFYRMSDGEAVAFLSGSSDGAVGPAEPMDVTVAEALIAVNRRIDDTARGSYYVKSARHRWDHEQGYTLEVKFINFVGAR